MQSWSNFHTSRGRRLFIAICALSASALMMRSTLASALINRGDGLFAYGAPGAAKEYYRRAMTLDDSNSTALDRYVFVMIQHRDRKAVQQAVRIETNYLLKHPGDAVILGDRGLCLLELRQYRAARKDFERAHALNPNDPLFVAAVRTLSRKRKFGS